MSTKAVVLARRNAAVELDIDSISPGGAQMIGGITLGIREHVQILFEIAGRPVEVRGEVVRSEPIDLDTSHVAVRFVDVADGVKQCIHQLVQTMLDLQEA